MTPLYIFDLDGTLANADHRRHLVEKPKCTYCGGSGYIDSPTYADSECPKCNTVATKFKPDWNAFFDACDKDTPVKPVIDTLSALYSMGCDIWIWSGRSRDVIDKTAEWILQNVTIELFDGTTDSVIDCDELHDVLRMRPSGDFTPDDVLKKQWLDAMSAEDRGRLVAVFDDRQKVVDMWRANGVACFQVAKGDF